MNGPVGLTLQLAAASAAPGGRLRLRAGEVLSIRVGKSLGGNRYEITLRGVSLSVRSSVPLPSGRFLQARVAVTGKRIELKILEPAAATGQPRSAAAPIQVPAPAASDPAAILIQSMRRTGLPVTVATMGAISAMIPSSRRSNPSYVRLATLLYDKHLHVEPERLEELYLVINGRGERGTGGGRGSRRETGGGPGGRNPAREPGASTPGQSTPTNDGPASSPAQHAGAGTLLRTDLRRRLSAGSIEEVGWPAFINHPIGEHESWIVVPFSLGGDERGAIEGSIRLRITPPAGGALAAGKRLQVSRAVVVVGELGAFEISGAPPRHVTIHHESEAMRTRIASLVPELREKLRNLGVEIDDTNNGGAVFDGFSAETIEIRGVDASA